MNATLYNAEILRLAAAIPLEERLQSPQGSARRQSPICGSRVTADVMLNEAGDVREFGQEVRACALGQASAAILAANVIGQNPAKLRQAHMLLASWLKEQGALPEPLAIHFPRLALFEPARAHPARHASILLAFDAAASAAEEAASLAAAS